jgi:hypothetical protein
LYFALRDGVTAGAGDSWATEILHDLVRAIPSPEGKWFRPEQGFVAKSGEPEDLDDIRPGVSRLRATGEDVNSIAHRHYSEAVTRRR